MRVKAPPIFRYYDIKSNITECDNYSENFHEAFGFIQENHCNSTCPNRNSLSTKIMLGKKQSTRNSAPALTGVVIRSPYKKASWKDVNRNPIPIAFKNAFSLSDCLHNDKEFNHDVCNYRRELSPFSDIKEKTRKKGTPPQDLSVWMISGSISSIAWNVKKWFWRTGCIFAIIPACKTQRLWKDTLVRERWWYGLAALSKNSSRRIWPEYFWWFSRSSCCLNSQRVWLNSWWTCLANNLDAGYSRIQGETDATFFDLKNDETKRTWMNELNLSKTDCN